MSRRLGIGLFGENGHQVTEDCLAHRDVRLVGVAGFREDFVPAGVKQYANLADMLMDDEIELISLCSSVRAAHAVACLWAGKHVYAEKPCALSLRELDEITAVAKETGFLFREMAGTAFEEPYLSISKIVRSGQIGEVVQVLAQKSYPYYGERPQDEDVDGGLLLQAGIHALRLVTHAAGQEIIDIQAMETRLGNPVPGGKLRMAVSMQMTLANGGVASIIANYLNQRGYGAWGNDHLRIFGDKGFIESTDGGRRTRLVVGDKDFGAVQTRGDVPTYFDMLVEAALGRGKMPLSSEEELRPLRAALLAKMNCK